MSKGKTRRGRPRKPTYLKILQGTTRPERENELEPKPPVGLPPPPDFIEKDRVALEEWNTTGKQLADIGAMTRIDRAALAAYCVEYSTWVDAITKVQETSRIIKAPSGYPIQNPYLAIANKAYANFTRMLVEFGMTPSSRSRIRAGEPSGAGDDFEKFLNGEIQ